MDHQLGGRVGERGSGNSAKVSKAQPPLWLITLPPPPTLAQLRVPLKFGCLRPFHTYMDLPFPPHLAQYTCRDILARRHHDQGTHTLAIP